MENIKLNTLMGALNDYAQEAEVILKGKLLKDDRKATGNLINSLKVRVEINSTIYSVILNCKDYLRYLEYGTKPHWPPVQPILKWVRDKGLPTKEKTGNKTLPTEKQLAFLVSRKISREGTKANNYMATTVEELNAKYIPILEKALKADIITSLDHTKLLLRFV